MMLPDSESTVVVVAPAGSDPRVRVMVPVVVRLSELPALLIVPVPPVVMARATSALPALTAEDKVMLPAALTARELRDDAGVPMVTLLPPCAIDIKLEALLMVTLLVPKLSAIGPVLFIVPPLPPPSIAPAPATERETPPFAVRLLPFKEMLLSAPVELSVSAPLNEPPIVIALVTLIAVGEFIVSDPSEAGEPILRAGDVPCPTVIFPDDMSRVVVPAVPGVKAIAPVLFRTPLPPMVPPPSAVSVMPPLAVTVPFTSILLSLSVEIDSVPEPSLFAFNCREPVWFIVSEAPELVLANC